MHFILGSFRKKTTFSWHYKRRSSSGNWMHIFLRLMLVHSVQSSLQKQNFLIAVKNYVDAFIKVFYSFLIFLDFFSLLQFFFFKIGWLKKFLFINCPSVFPTSIFWFFLWFENLSQIFNVNIKPGSRRKFQNLTAFCKRSHCTKNEVFHYEFLQ